MKFITRFAPSPTGPLHLGHAYSAMLAHDKARVEGGDFLLRIDNLDQSRARDHWEDMIYEDLSWLGVTWIEPCRKQSMCQVQYNHALDTLWNMGLLYECKCTRRDIRNSQSAPQEGVPIVGPDGLIYPGTCRGLNRLDQDPVGLRPKNVTLRLNIAKAIIHRRWSENFVSTHVEHDQSYGQFSETGPRSNTQAQSYEFTSEFMLSCIGDVVVSRKNMGAAYHLAVVVDDQDQKVNHIVRGEDLLEATIIHLLIGHLLVADWQAPSYHHHKLIRDDTGKRLAKRDDARAIGKYRAEGATPQDIRKLVGLD